LSAYSYVPGRCRGSVRSVPVGSTVWLINEPVKIAYVDGKLLLEVHPPVDGEGQVAQVDPEAMSQKLAIGSVDVHPGWPMKI
jgi:hypothetical protein